MQKSDRICRCLLPSSLIAVRAASSTQSSLSTCRSHFPACHIHFTVQDSAFDETVCGPAAGLDVGAVYVEWLCGQNHEAGGVGLEQTLRAEDDDLCPQPFWNYFCPRPETGEMCLPSHESNASDERSRGLQIL